MYYIIKDLFKNILKFASPRLKYEFNMINPIYDFTPDELFTVTNCLYGRGNIFYVLKNEYAMEYFVDKIITIKKKFTQKDKDKIILLTKNLDYKCVPKLLDYLNANDGQNIKYYIDRIILHKSINYKDFLDELKTCDNFIPTLEYLAEIKSDSIIPYESFDIYFTNVSFCEPSNNIIKHTLKIYHSNNLINSIKYLIIAHVKTITNSMYSKFKLMIHNYLNEFSLLKSYESVNTILDLYSSGIISDNFIINLSHPTKFYDMLFKNKLSELSSNILHKIDIFNTLFKSNNRTNIKIKKYVINKFNTPSSFIPFNYSPIINADLLKNQLRICRSFIFIFDIDFYELLYIKKTEEILFIFAQINKFSIRNEISILDGFISFYKSDIYKEFKINYNNLIKINNSEFYMLEINNLKLLELNIIDDVYMFFGYMENNPIFINKFKHKIKIDNIIYNFREYNQIIHYTLLKIHKNTKKIRILAILAKYLKDSGVRDYIKLFDILK